MPQTTLPRFKNVHAKMKPQTAHAASEAIKDVVAAHDWKYLEREDGSYTILAGPIRFAVSPEEILQVGTDLADSLLCHKRHLAKLHHDWRTRR